MLVFLYFILILVIGGISYQKINGHKDFFIAGKNGNSLEIAGSLLATILGSSAILGSVDSAYEIGWAGSWLLLTAALGLMLLYPFLKYIAKFQNYNLSELLGDIYGIEVQILASFVIPIAWLGVVSSQIIGAAKIVMILSSINYIEAVILSGGVFIIYTFLGGQLSIIKTDFFQLLFILVGVLVTFFYIGENIKDIEGLGIVNEKFNYLDVMVLILTYSTTCLVGPDIYSRLFCAKDIIVMKKALIITVAILVPMAFILSGIGIYGREVLNETHTGLKSVLLLIAERKLNRITSIFLYFGLLSAVISSADTTLLTASSLFTQCFFKNLKNERSVLVTRYMIIFLGIISIGIALYFKSILGSLLLAIAIYSGAFIVPAILGILGFRSRKEVVITAIIIGGMLAFIGKIIGGDKGNYILIFSFILNFGILLIGKKITTHYK